MDAVYSLYLGLNLLIDVLSILMNKPMLEQLKFNA